MTSSFSWQCSQMSLSCTVAFLFSSVLSSLLCYSLCSLLHLLYQLLLYGMQSLVCDSGLLCISVCLSCSITVPRRSLRLVTSVTVHITNCIWNSLLWLTRVSEDRSHAHTMPHMYNRNIANGQWVHTAAQTRITVKLKYVCFLQSRQEKNWHYSSD